MFGRVARRYDLLNHLLSANLDRRWRRIAVSELPPDPEALVLDLCGGTGDLGLAALRAGRAARVVCCDFSHPMLVLAARKFRRHGETSRCVPLEADGLRLPFASDRFDAVTVGFGVRNFSDLGRGLEETRRILRPGGTLVVLEFSQPTAPVISGLYRFYLRRILPRLGDTVSGNTGPYAYLAGTISAFPDPPTLADRIRDVGFSACSWTTASGGIVAVHRAVK
jgi:demethylmenaquinone methyltransferase/2-methoxy-6-polyprenyl-1,4-benzoquinol methylase